MLIGVVFASCQQQEREDKPNILLIIADDLGYGDLSFLPDSPDDVHTANIDQLARQGSYFSNAYATSPICSPSRTGLLTGRYQARWGNYWYGEGGLPDSEFTLAQMLAGAGYHTHKIGKTHLNGGPVEHPLDHGFDEFLGFIDHTWDYLRLSEKDLKEYGEKNARQAHMGPLTHNRQEVSFENDYTTDIFTRKAIDVIHSVPEKPFYIHLSYNAVHHPTYVCHPDYLDDFGIEQFPFWDPEKESYQEWHMKRGLLGEVDPDGRKRYLLQLKVLDEGIGRIIKALKSTGQYKNTILIFISDNGGTINTYANNQPLNGYKYMFGEGGIRVPLLISWPGHLPKNKRVDALVTAMDIFPTLADITGQADPGDLDGTSLIPLLRGQTDRGHETLFFSNGRDCWVVRHGHWKLAHNIAWKHSSFKIEDGLCIRDSTYYYPGGTRLYDLNEDIAEQNDLAEIYPSLVDSLQKLYANWRHEMADPMRSSQMKQSILPEGEQLPPIKDGYETEVWSDGAQLNHYPRLAMDENPDTWWQAQNGNNAMLFPHHLVIDFKDSVLIKGIRYQPVHDQGHVKEFEIYISSQKENWNNPVYQGQFPDENKSQEVIFSQAKKGRYLKFRILSAFDSQRVTSVAEIEIIRIN